ncbi:AAA family ATPase [Pseudonocardia humida]|uniref:Uridine kinase n=1 Tax=Pseudonocardia humida TaxID=2800819 RepID=A0ABT0ZVM6_9PSEU|nr:AAA family ATPase [Pseudonocardia humida]MCO1654719.1 uridine kinase [Pseudonocardia humida]
MAKDPPIPALARLDREVVGFGEVAAGVRAAQARCGGTRLVCVDGLSGAGKTALAQRLAAALDGPPVLHMDDLYDGWDGLSEGVRRLRALVEGLVGGGPARYHRYDWHAGAYGAEVDLGRPDVLVVEGVGAGSVAERASLVLWLEAPETVRYRRSMARDGETYRPYWEAWASQERAHFAGTGTAARADLVVDGAPAVHYDPATQVVLLGDRSSSRWRGGGRSRG